MNKASTTVFVIGLLFASIGLSQGGEIKAVTKEVTPPPGSQQNLTIIKDTILDSRSLFEAKLIDDSGNIILNPRMVPAGIVLILREHADERFLVKPALAFESGIIPEDGHFQAERISGWEVELTYDVKSKREIDKKSGYEVVSLKVINRGTSQPN